MLMLCPVNDKIDWLKIEQQSWVQPLKDCQQDPEYHREGDVWSHTKMVCEALVSSDQWNFLSQEEKNTLFLAALLHDVGKPVCTRIEDGRITSKGHSSAGEMIARSILWQNEVPFRTREKIASLIRFHMLPFFWEDEKKTIRASLSCRCEYLYYLGLADNEGREPSGVSSASKDAVEMFWLKCDELKCLMSPMKFISDHSRFCYFNKDGWHWSADAYDDSRLEVWMMCGLPYSGKDFWIGENRSPRPIVSLDEIREELRVLPTENQSEVISAAKSRCKKLLSGAFSFTFNATSLTRKLRSEWIELFTAYKARIRIVYIEAPRAVLIERMNDRERHVPIEVIDEMASRSWQVPTLDECHSLESFVND